MKAFSMINPFSPIVQAVIGPSNYLRDHTKQQDYIENSTFLPYINNEIDHSKSKLNKKRFESLNFITMVKFLKDPIIYPKESSWFGQIDESGNTLPMEQTEIYLHNLFGLKTLDQEKRISKKEINGLHL